MTAASSHNDTEYNAALAQCPLVAILRGVTPAAVDAIGKVLVEAGFRLIEVPLNSPDPLISIARLVTSLGDRAMIGAGTVLTVEQVSGVALAGGRLIVSPNTDAAVIAATRSHGLISVPGFATVSEAFAAHAAGANALKLFPAEAASPQVLKAMRAILPATARVLPVGGIAPNSMAEWLRAGAAGFGLGSALYSAGDTPDVIAQRARTFIANWRSIANS